MQFIQMNTKKNGQIFITEAWAVYIENAYNNVNP